MAEKEEEPNETVEEDWPTGRAGREDRREEAKKKKKEEVRKEAAR